MSETGDCLTCPACGRTYHLNDGVANLLPQYDDDTHTRYLQNYEDIAVDDLAEPLEANRDIRQAELMRFIGSVAGKRVLDIGSGDGVLLRDMDAEVKVALDISLTYLHAMKSPDSTLFRVCADAEKLPVAIGYFDVIVVSGVLEHLLAPETLVARLRQVCRPDTRVIVLVPWEEDLTPYRSMPWEFTHLRTFGAFTFSQLFHQFRIVRKKAVWPRMSDPVLFRLDKVLPAPIFDFLRYAYFHRGLAKREGETRMRWYAELPRREGRLLSLYPPTFYQFELKTFVGSWIPGSYERLAGASAWLRRLVTRSR